MSKIVIEFDTNTSKAVLKIGKTKIDDFDAIFIHKDVLNEYKFSFQMFANEGIASVKNGDVVVDSHQKLFLARLLAYFQTENKDEQATDL
jgi:hypothetical protein